MARILDTVFLGASPWQNGPPDLFSDLLQDWHDRLALPFVPEIVLPFRMAKSPPILVADLPVSFILWVFGQLICGETNGLNQRP